MHACMHMCIYIFVHMRMRNSLVKLMQQNTKKQTNIQTNKNVWLTKTALRRISNQPSSQGTIVDNSNVVYFWNPLPLGAVVG